MPDWVKADRIGIVLISEDGARTRMFLESHGALELGEADGGRVYLLGGWLIQVQERSPPVVGREAQEEVVTVGA